MVKNQEMFNFYIRYRFSFQWILVTNWEQVKILHYNVTHYKKLHPSRSIIYYTILIGFYSDDPKQVGENININACCFTFLKVIPLK